MNFLNRPLDYTRTPRQARDRVAYGDPITRFDNPHRGNRVYAVVTMVCFAAIGVMLAC